MTDEIEIISVQSDDTPEKDTSKRARTDEETSASNLEIASECPICYEPYVLAGKRQSVVTKCGHFFCVTCITTVAKSRTPKCPLCQERVRANDLIRVYGLVSCRDKGVDDEEVEALRFQLESERSKRIKVGLNAFFFSLPNSLPSFFD